MIKRAIRYFESIQKRYITIRRKCKKCNYSDICAMIETPSDEACEAIRSCTKEFLYDKIWESLYEYFNQGGE